MVDLLTGKTQQGISELPLVYNDTAPLKILPKKQYRIFDEEAVQQKLLDILQSDVDLPRSMAKVADALGYDHPYLIKKFPHLTQQISERYATYVQQKRQEILALRKQELESTILKLHAAGIYPSHRRLKKEYRSKMRWRSSQQVIKHVLHKLGYEDE